MSTKNDDNQSHNEGERLKLEMEPSVIREFKELPEEIQGQFSNSIHAICHGMPPLLKIKHLYLSKGLSAIELIINGSPGYRCVYTTKIKGKIHVVYAREKTATGTDKQLIDVVSKRLKKLK